MSDIVVGRDFSCYVSPSGERIPRKWANFVNGTIPVEELDDQELHREQLRNINGTFASRPSDTVPRSLRRIIGAEIQRRFNLRYQAVIPESQDVFIEVMNDPSADAKDRMRAAQYVQERVMGKIPDKVEMTAEVKPWEGLIGEIIHDVDDMFADDATLELDGPNG